ncbi:hypothetical protein ABTY61_22775 [Kitasatospora sp. NPDC096128]|uniref:hypothetical protein n=1 Tax=Kitasatospora sp. NPDC096128 TaxID=3155547 RepID=UPI0033309CDF
MTSTDTIDFENVAACFLTAVDTIEKEIMGLASSLGFFDDLDRITLIPDRHQTIPHTASLRRRLAIVDDLLEQAGAGVLRRELSQPLPGSSALAILAVIHEAKSTVEQAHRAVCAQVEHPALRELTTAANAMRQVNRAVLESPRLAEQRAAAADAVGEAPQS